MTRSYEKIPDDDFLDLLMQKVGRQERGSA